MKATPVESIVAAQVAAQVTAEAALLDLPIAAEHRPGVVAYFTLATEMARLVNGLPLDMHDESGSVFLPVVPGAGHVSTARPREGARSRPAAPAEGRRVHQ